MRESLKRQRRELHSGKLKKVSAVWFHAGRLQISQDTGSSRKHETYQFLCFIYAPLHANKLGLGYKIQ